MPSSLPYGIYDPAGSENTETGSPVTHHSAPPTSPTPNTVGRHTLDWTLAYLRCTNLGEREREPALSSD